MRYIRKIILLPKQTLRFPMTTEVQAKNLELESIVCFTQMITYSLWWFIWPPQYPPGPSQYQLRSSQYPPGPSQYPSWSSQYPPEVLHPFSYRNVYYFLSFDVLVYLSLFFSFVFFQFFITYFSQLHFQFYPKSPPYPPPTPLPTTPTFWPWRSPVLGHIKFASPMGFSFQWWPTRPSFDTYAARVKSSGVLVSS